MDRAGFGERGMGAGPQRRGIAGVGLGIAAGGRSRKAGEVPVGAASGRDQPDARPPTASMPCPSRSCPGAGKASVASPGRSPTPAVHPASLPGTLPRKILDRLPRPGARRARLPAERPPPGAGKLPRDPV